MIGLMSATPTIQNFREARRAMVDWQLRGRGTSDERVLQAMTDIPREWFVGDAQKAHAYDDCALPVDCGQTISQPIIVATMTEALRLRGEEEVLEIGTGSGYQTAILARLAREVFTIEWFERLSQLAQARCDRLGIRNVHFAVGDGTQGWPEARQFDAILVAAGGPHVPHALLDQLRDGGRLVIPIGDRESQNLVELQRDGEQTRERVLLACRFVPLLGCDGWRAGRSDD